MLISVSSLSPLNEVGVRMVYDASQVVLRSVMAVPGSELSSFDVDGSVDGLGNVVVTITASGASAVTSAGVARVSLVRMASGAVSLESLVAGLEVVCVGCSW